ncbi:MAG: ComEA family DNA-binding protein [Myxococcales bacterium]|jgi:competence protein ComEA
MSRIDSSSAASTWFARAIEWRWSKPIGRALLAIGALLIFAIVGRTAVAGKAESLSLVAAASASVSSAALEPEPSSVALAASATSVPSAEPTPAPVVQGPATPENPVVLNTATLEDFRRLPGIGQKRALALLSLRTKLGKFRQVEDLLKVKGIGAKTLKRLRPLVRLEAPVTAKP